MKTDTHQFMCASMDGEFLTTETSHENGDICFRVCAKNGIFVGAVYVDREGQLRLLRMIVDNLLPSS